MGAKYVACIDSYELSNIIFENIKHFGFQGMVCSVLTNKKKNFEEILFNFEVKDIIFALC